MLERALSMKYYVAAVKKLVPLIVEANKGMDAATFAQHDKEKKTWMLRLRAA